MLLYFVYGCKWYSTRLQSGSKGPNGKEIVVAHGGKSVTPDEHKFTVSKQECLAIVDGIKAYKDYLTKCFTVITDQALKWLNSVEDTSFRLGRWALELQGYDFEIVHKPGRVHMNADACQEDLTMT